MEDLGDLLETRCVDVFDLTGNDTTVKNALIGRGLLSHYLTKVSDFLGKAFRTGFDIDYAYSDKACLFAIYPEIARWYGTIPIQGKDGFAYYFHKAGEMFKALTLRSDSNEALISAFSDFPKEFVAKFPKTLGTSRCFRGDEMTMAGFLVFLAPMVSPSDATRLMEDATRVFAKDITYFQGMHTDDLSKELAGIGKSKVLEPFGRFFQSQPNGSDLSVLLQILFGDKAKYAKIESEAEGTYSFVFDNTRMNNGVSWVVAGTIADKPGEFEVVYDPIKTKFEFPISEKKKAWVRFDKSVLKSLLPYAERIPACMLSLAFALIWEDARVTEDFLRTVASGLLFLECGAYWYDDKDRFEDAETPLYRVGICLEPALRKVLSNGLKRRSLSAESKEEMRKTVSNLIYRSQFIRMLWAYDLDYDTEMTDSQGKKVLYSIQDLAYDLSESYRFLTSFGKYTDVFVRYALKGLSGFMSLIFEDRFTNELVASRRMLDPLTVNENQWRAYLSDGESLMEEGSQNRVPDDAIAAMADCPITLDAYVYADQDYLNSNSTVQRFFTNLIRVTVTAEHCTIFVKGKDTRMTKMVFFVTDLQNDLQSITGSNGEPLILVSKATKMGFVQELTMKLD